MLLTIDIGNTVVSFGVLKKGKLVKFYSVKTRLPSAELRSGLKKVLSRIDDDFGSIKGVVVCSVVPHVTKVIKSLIKDQMDLAPIIIGEDVSVPIKNLYRDPKQVGQDRLVGAYAVKKIYGTPAIVIDLGTAITFDVVTKKGEYDGGMIIPGIQLSADSLFQKTALLPRIETIEGPRNLIGKTTKESILSGIFHGYGAMCTGLIEAVSKKLRTKPKVILTGGYTRIMRKYISRKGYKIDRDLVFKGMYLIFKNMKGPLF